MKEEKYKSSGKKRMDNKVKIVFLLVFCFLLFLIILAFFLFNRENEKKHQPSISSGVFLVSQNTYVGYDYQESFKDKYFVVKDDHLGMIDSKGNIVLDFLYPANARLFIGKDAFVIESDGKYYLYDKDLNLLLVSDHKIDLWEDLKTEETYYTLDDTLYNLKKEVIYKAESLSEFPALAKVDNYLFVTSFAESKLLNLQTGEEIKVSAFVAYPECLYGVSTEDKKFYLYDFDENNLKTYSIMDTSKVKNSVGYSLQDEEGKEYFYTEEYGLVNKQEGIKAGSYQLDFKSCSNGFQVYDLKGNLLSKECYETYSYWESLDVIVLENENAHHFLHDGSILEDLQENTVEGKYIGSVDSKDDTFHLFTWNGEEVKDNPCYYSLRYEDDDTYLCDDGSKQFLVDENLQKKSDSYDEISCIEGDTDYCIYTVNNKMGLLWNNEVILPAIYNNMFVNYDNHQIIAESLWQFDVFSYTDTTSDKALEKEEIHLSFAKPYDTISTSSMIKKYNLSKDTDIIYANEELFKKYAYVVENNSKLGSYKQQVMNLFSEVALNKEYLEENAFLYSLKQLSITKTDHLEEECVDGFYNRYENTIELLSDDDYTLYHQFTHFVASAMNHSFFTDVFKCGDQYLSTLQILQLNALQSKDCQYWISEEPSFLLEGGAEYFAANYFNQKLLKNYYVQTNILGALTYLYGYDTMNAIYFDAQEGIYHLFMLFQKAGVSIEDYRKFLEITSPNHTLLESEVFFLTDTLLKMYEKEKNEKWYLDKEFSEIIRFLIGSNTVKESYTTRYQEYQKLDRNFLEKYEKLLDLKEKNWTILDCSYLKAKDGSYVILKIQDDEKTVLYDVVKYDFKQDKEIDSKIFKS